MKYALSNEELPASADVVVIGGGIVGVCTAVFLAKAGMSVVLCEKGRIAGEQSSRNWGWIRKAGRDVRELQLMIDSAAIWKELVAELDEDIGYGIRGTTYLAKTDAELEKHKKWLAESKDFNHGAVLLDGAETDRLLKRNDREFLGALHTESDATAEPSLAVPAFGRLASKLGVKIFENCAVRTVERSAGAVTSVVTEHGEIKTGKAILAGGAWSRTFLENLGVRIPQLAVKSSVLRTTPGPEVVVGTAGAGQASLRRRQDGGYTIAKSGAAEFQIIPAAFRYFVEFLPTLRAEWRIMKIRIGKDFFGPLGHHRWSGDQVTPFEAVRTMDPTPDLKLLNKVLANAKALHPRLADVEIAETWAGLIDVMPDEVPVIDEPTGWSGLVIATGLSGHGFGIGPGLSKQVANYVQGLTPLVDPKPFLLTRFRN